MSSKLTIEERVDILLKEGVENPKKWAKVHGYKDPEVPVVMGDLRAAEEWQRLRDHHLDETTFLFEIIDALVKRVKKQ